jgi:phosphate-selective porin OprO/OprP
VVLPPPPPGPPTPVGSDARLRKLEDLNARLEQQNQKLAEQNERLEQQNQRLQAASAPPPPSSPAPPVSADDAKKAADGSVKDNAAQKKADEPATKAAEAAADYEVGSDLGFKTFWRDGFMAETANKDFRVHIGGKLQNDYGWFAPDANLRAAFPTGTPAAPGPGPNAWNDGADLRRARLRVDGTLWEIIDFVFEYEFAQTQQVTSSAGSATIISATGPTDTYIDVKELPYVGRVRLGHFKEPYSLEDYGTNDVYLTFLERSSASDAFSPNRNFGIMNWNDPFDQRVVYGVGLFKENTNTNIGNAFDYGTNAYAATARLGLNPWYENDGGCVLFFGGAYSFRRYDNSSALDRYRYATRIPIRVGSPILLDTTSLIADDSQLFNAQALLIYGPFSLQGEFYASQGAGVVRGLRAVGVPREFSPQLNGAYVMATFFLTGEHRTYVREMGGVGRIRPLEPFYLVPRGGLGSGLGSCFGRGAWELAARYDYVDLHSRAFDALAAVPGVPGSAAAAIPTVGIEHDILLGLNWYLNPNVKVQWNFTHALREVPTPVLSGSVDAFAMRLTFDF